jgi:integrase
MVLRCERYLLHAVTQWLLERTHSDETVSHYLASFRWWVMATGRRRLDMQCTVSAYHLTHWLGLVAQSCPSPRTQNKHASIIRSWYAWLVAQEAPTAEGGAIGLLGRSPFRRRDHIRRVQHSRVYNKPGQKRISLEKADAQRAIDYALSPATAPDQGFACALHVAGGLRRCEIRRVELRHFAERGPDLELLVYGKGDKTRTVRVEAPLLAALKRLVKHLEESPGRAAKHGPLCRSPYDPAKAVHRDTLSDWIKRMAVAIGMPYISTHDLRRTNCTLLRDAGADRHQVAEHLGHSNAELTDRCYDTKRRDLAGVSTGLEATA